MSYQSMQFGRLYLVRWGTATHDDVWSVLREVQRAHATYKQPLIGVAIVPADAEPPTDNVRAAMVKSLDDLLGCCERVYFVMEGSGFRQSVMRSVLAGLLLVGGKRGRIGVHDSVGVALGLAAPLAGHSKEEILAEAYARGVLTRPVAAVG